VAAAHFSEMAEWLFAGAPYRELADPLDRVLGYIDFRAAILAGPVQEFTCLLGTMVQEAYDTHPAIRQACDTYIGVHAAGVAKDIEAAKALHAPGAPWSAESLALFTQAVLQGGFVLAKAKGGPEVARDCVAISAVISSNCSIVPQPARGSDPCRHHAEPSSGTR